jgi:NADH-quinone oxidoreductase subunit L
VLAVFAIFAGYVGVHPDFPVFGSIFSANGNPFFDFITTSLAVKPEKVSFYWVPVLTSFAVGLGGIGLGYLMYWRKPLVAGEPDPLVKILGAPLHTTLKNKYYFDELYTMIFIRPSQWFSKNVAYEFVDRGLIDGSLHFMGKLFTWIGDFIKVLNAWLIDGFGDGLSELIARAGIWFRRIQGGSVQQYLLIVALAAIVIVIVFALSTGVLQAAP